MSEVAGAPAPRREHYRLSCGCFVDIVRDRVSEVARARTSGELLAYLDADCRAPLALVRAYDLTLAPATQLLVEHVLGIGTIFYGGNFAVRRRALEQIGGFDTSIEFRGEDTNLVRRLLTAGEVGLCQDCWLYTSARRYHAMGKGAVFRLDVRNSRPRFSTTGRRTPRISM